jgi:hypothetical protein
MDKYNTFRDNQIKLQRDWRKSQENISKENGIYKGKSYDYIIPEGEWQETIFPKLKEDLRSYLKEKNIEPHEGAHDLLSSWILCANLYFGTRINDNDNFKELFRQFLKEKLSLQIDKIDDIDLEYTPTGKLSPKEILGEYGENRHTRPDIAVHINDKEGLILGESKYTEKSFYDCSAGPYYPENERIKQFNPNPDIMRCMKMKILNNLKNDCHSYKEWRRKYWDQLSISENGMRKFKECPACNGGFQLVRQQALAEGIAKSGKYKKVVSCVAFDGRNEVLMKCMESSGIKSIRDEWKELFNLKSGFSVWEHQEWVEYVRQHGKTEFETEWCKYMKDRYDM